MMCMYTHQGWVQFHVELGIEVLVLVLVINSNSTGIGIEIIEIIGIEYFLEKVIGIDESNWCISSIPI